MVCLQSKPLPPEGALAASHRQFRGSQLRTILARDSRLSWSFLSWHRETVSLNATVIHVFRLLILYAILQRAARLRRSTPPAGSLQIKLYGPLPASASSVQSATPHRAAGAVGFSPRNADFSLVRGLALRLRSVRRWSAGPPYRANENILWMGKAPALLCQM